MRHLFLTTLVAVAAPCASALGGTSPFQDWNLIVRNNLVLTTSEVDGSTLIGGDLAGTSNYAVQGVTAPNGDGLAVGGILAGGSNYQINNGGNLRVTALANIQGTPNLNGGGVTVVDPTVPMTADALVDQAASISGFLAGLTPNGMLDGAGNLTATPVMIDGQNVAVYDIASTDLNGLGQLNLSIGTADSVIINLAADAGMVDLQAPPNLVGDFTQGNSTRILWNLFDATDVVVNNNLNGALFAPGADLELLGGGINGTVVVDTLSLQQAEIRRFTYTGFLPAPSAALLLAGPMVLVRRRRG